MPEITIADFYCRMSEAESLDRAKLEEQEQICREYCVAHDLTLGLVSYDSRPGTMLHERMALNRMRKRYLDGTIQGVIIMNPDRLSRSLVRQAILVSEMEQHNIAIHVIEGRLEETPHGRYLLALSALLSEVDREKGLGTIK